MASITNAQGASGLPAALPKAGSVIPFVIGKTTYYCVVDTEGFKFKPECPCEGDTSVTTAGDRQNLCRFNVAVGKLIGADLNSVVAHVTRFKQPLDLYSKDLYLNRPEVPKGKIGWTPWHYYAWNYCDRRSERVAVFNLLKYLLENHKIFRAGKKKREAAAAKFIAEEQARLKAEKVKEREEALLKFNALTRQRRRLVEYAATRQLASQRHCDPVIQLLEYVMEVDVVKMVGLAHRHYINIDTDE